MSVKSLTALLGFAMAVIIIALGGVFYLHQEANTEQSQQLNLQVQAQGLTKQLATNLYQQASSARAFVIGGDKSAQEQHQQIQQQRQALTEPLRSLGLSTAEESKLSIIHSRANSLNEVELQAINARLGKYRDYRGEYNVSGAVDLELAAELLFSQAYEKSQTDAQRAVTELESLINQRLNEQAHAKESMAWQLAQGFYGLTALLFMFMIVSLWQLAVRTLRKSHSIQHCLGHSLQACEDLNSLATELYQHSTTTQLSLANLLHKAEQNNHSANEVDTLVLKTQQDSEQINHAVTRLIELITELKATTEQVEDVAQQVNLLALNASIEAARAGDEGKGFNVVAEELHKLTRRSKAAARDIEHLSTASIEQAEQSAQLLAQVVPNIQHSVGLSQTASELATSQFTDLHELAEKIALLLPQVEANNLAAHRIIAAISQLRNQNSELQPLSQPQ